MHLKRREKRAKEIKMKNKFATVGMVVGMADDFLFGGPAKAKPKKKLVKKKKRKKKRKTLTQPRYDPFGLYG